MQLPTIEEIEERKRRSLIEAHARVQSFVHYWTADRVLGLARVGENAFPLHIDDISRLLHAAYTVIAPQKDPSIAAALDWQPIETAPKDGTWVLLSGGKTTEYDYCNDHVRLDRPVTAFWSEENGWAFCYWDGMWREAYKDPTHWCRLP